MLPSASLLTGSVKGAGWAFFGNLTRNSPSVEASRDHKTADARLAANSTGMKFRSA